MNSPQLSLVVMAGNIGVGKTAVGSRLAHALRLPLYEESVSDNPYLERFYADMPRWVFYLNMFFLAHRAEQMRAAAGRGGGVLDRSLQEDEIFVQMARDDGVTSDENYAVFASLIDTLIDLLPAPTVLIYLRAEPSALVERIASRDRVFEGPTLDLSYLQALQARYDTWIEQYTASPVIARDTTTVDFRVDGPDFATLVDEVRHHLH
jgi:deoxyadenosine/deoxycytidine kinase